MSWIVQSLLMDKNVIKDGSNINSDELDDLIVVEKAIESLRKSHVLSTDDLKIIDEFTGDDSSFPLTTSNQRKGLRKRFNTICNRIAFYLGGSFTDEGYINYMRKKYKLTDAQINKLQNYMTSAYKHKIIRKPKTDE